MASALLCVEDGAIFSGLIEQKKGGSRASYRVASYVGSGVHVQHDVRVFSCEAEARTWIDQEARRRGFQSYPLEVLSADCPSSRRPARWPFLTGLCATAGAIDPSLATLLGVWGS